MLRVLILLFCLLAAPAFAGDIFSSGKIQFFDESQDAILQPDQAFKLAVSAIDGQTLKASFTIAPGHYLYRERISFKLKPGSAGNVASVDLPSGEAKHDPNFGDTVVYHRDFDAIIRLQPGNSAPATVTLLASYQGCSEKGLCYAPIKKTLDISLPATGASVASFEEDESGRIKSLLQSGKLWLIALGFFGFGLLLSLTPCVLPMIPILSGIIIGQGAHPTRLHAFNLSLAYTLGMALSYTLAGVAAGLSGHLISSALQNPWALGFGALIFVLLALSMFGFYELQLPSGLESRVVGLTNRIKGGRFAGVFVMGILSALILSPCVAAPLAGTLLFISQTHDVVLGGVALFALSLGMGVPLLVVGASAGALLPKTGPWMNTVRNFFGVVMLGMAVWLVGPVIPASVQMALWATLLIIPAIYLHALDSLPPKASRWAKLWKGAGIIALVCGIALLLGALAGSKNALQPLAGLYGAAAEKPKALPFQPVKNLGELEVAIKQAKGRFVMLDFYADWCVSCKEYEQFTFSDPRVGKLLKDVVLLQADVTANTPKDHAMLQRFGLFGPPGIIFFDKLGGEIPQVKTVGYQNADRFLVTLNTLYSHKDGECAPTLEC
jgi:thiol:disulfide interchange protein DsbD